MAPSLCAEPSGTAQSGPDFDRDVATLFASRCFDCHNPTDHKAGLDLKTVLQSVGGGAAASWSLNNLGPRIIDRNFEPGFFVEHFLKDMGIALDEAKRMGIALPGLALANQLYVAVQAQGYGRKGTHALMLALEQLSNIKR